jgi:hypothetical protein
LELVDGDEQPDAEVRGNPLRQIPARMAWGHPASTRSEPVTTP